MDSILIKTKTDFPIEEERIKKRAERILAKFGKRGKIEVGISFVGRQEMRRLNQKFRGLAKASSILSFSQTEEGAGVRFKTPPDGIFRLGDIVICCQEAQRLADKEKVSVGEKIDQLVDHGLLNLLKTT
jgi:rRNA maturation RNase YbeY